MHWMAVIVWTHWKTDRASNGLQVWDIKTRKLKLDLPGHADEVFAVDWSPDGSAVASGGKDKVLKLWRH